MNNKILLFFAIICFTTYNIFGFKSGCERLQKLDSEIKAAKFVQDIKARNLSDKERETLIRAYQSLIAKYNFCNKCCCDLEIEDYIAIDDLSEKIDNSCT